MGLNRRTFLQKASLGLAILGVSEIVQSLLGNQGLAVPVLDRYFQALAQPSGRKLALLVGINQYPHSTALTGCVTDVELQRELLIHRFGFKSSDILTLTDSQASRENIETAFVEHLTEQAQAGDVVVFHFSGYGSHVQKSQEILTDDIGGFQTSLVPSDGILPTKEALVGNNLLEETLVLLLRSLSTNYVTAVLDTSYVSVNNILQGNLRVRSYPNSLAQTPSPKELAFQEQLRLRTNSLTQKLLSSTNPNQLPGVILAAAGLDELAKEAQWHGFSAGLFTYALTQYLWQVAPPTTIQISLSRTASMVNQWIGLEQQPRVINQKSQQSPVLAYYLPPDSSMGADGVVTAVEENGKVAQLWLAGLPATVWEYYGSNSILSLYPSPSLHEGSLDDQVQPTTQFIPQLQIRSKEGLTAKARIIGIGVNDNYSLKVGQFVQEAIRLLPRNLGLTIALDAGLERIERVDATSAFATINLVSSVVNAGEQPADYLFGKASLFPTTVPTAMNLQANLATTRLPELSRKTGGYGLFYLGYDPIRNTTGEVGEAVKSAVNRVAPKLQTLLAAKLLRLSVNEGSSHLGLRASLEIISPQATVVVMQRETWRTPPSSKRLTEPKIARDIKTNLGAGSLPTVPIGSRIQYRVENYSDRPIYFMLLGWDSSGNAIALYQNQSPQTKQDSQSKSPLEYALIAPGETLTLPHSPELSNWIVQGPAGLVEIQLICSRAPFKKGQMALEAGLRAKGAGEYIDDLFNSLDVVRAVLQDLHDVSAVAPDLISGATDSYALDINAWATLSFIYQVV